MNNPEITYVANHQTNACISLRDIGIHPDKILPYDWKHEVTPTAYQPKRHPGKRVWKLMFCGSLIESKGIGDIIKACAILSANNIEVALDIFGAGATEQFVSLASSLGIGDICNFVGRVSHDTVLSAMREADIVLVPSHHCYPEGFPMTICEALIVRTPLILSDHPMFENKLTHSREALVAREKSPLDIAESVKQYISDCDLYESVSRNAEPAWDKLQIPLLWGKMIEAWLRGGTEDFKFLQCHTISNNPT